MRVTGFTFGGGSENGCNVVVTLYICLGSKIQVATISLGFSGKCFFEIVFSL